MFGCWWTNKSSGDLTKNLGRHNYGFGRLDLKASEVQQAFPHPLSLPPPLAFFFSAVPTIWTARISFMPRGSGRGSRVGVVVRALAFHQCVPGSIPGPGVICGLSLLVLYSAPRGFSPGTPVFPSPQKPTFDLIWFIWFTVSPISTALVLG